jgi:hypothetical protein
MFVKAVKEEMEKEDLIKRIVILERKVEVLEEVQKEQMKKRSCLENRPLPDDYY